MAVAEALLEMQFNKHKKMVKLIGQKTQNVKNRWSKNTNLLKRAVQKTGNAKNGCPLNVKMLKAVDHESKAGKKNQFSKRKCC
jgi:hypothetical protein